VFSPTADEIAHAQRVVDAVQDAERSGTGVATLDGHMIDAATARSAFAIIQRDKRCQTPVVTPGADHSVSDTR
jgi:citrate lyase beta subunit